MANWNPLNKQIQNTMNRQQEQLKQQKTNPVPTVNRQPGRSFMSSVGDFMNRMTGTQSAGTTALPYTSKPIYSWSGKSADQMSTLEKTAAFRMLGGEQAKLGLNALAQESQQIGSRHYSPYLGNKSNQKEAAGFFGTNRFDDNWLEKNRYLLSYVTQNDLTDSVSTSGQKKWSDAQWAGYYYQAIAEAEPTTKAAEQEWAALRSDMQKNYQEYLRFYGKAPSYDELTGYIDMKKYPTLQKMDKVYTNVEDLVRLNRPVNYSPETMVGVYAALLDGRDVSGREENWFEDAVQYTMKPVTREEETPAQARDLSAWTPEQVEEERKRLRTGGTRKDLALFEQEYYMSQPHLDSVDSGSYFGNAYHDREFLQKYSYLDDYVKQLTNRDGKVEKPASGDPWIYKAAYEYSRIKEKEADTEAAENEWSRLRKYLTNIGKSGESVEDADIDWDDYPTLDKIRKGQNVELNRPLYFSEEAMKGVVQAVKDGQDAGRDDFDYAYYTTPEKADEPVYHLEKDNITPLDYVADPTEKKSTPMKFKATEELQDIFTNTINTAGSIKIGSGRPGKRARPGRGWSAHSARPGSEGTLDDLMDYGDMERVDLQQTYHGWEDALTNTQQDHSGLRAMISEDLWQKLTEGAPEGEEAEYAWNRLQAEKSKVGVMIGEEKEKERQQEEERVRENENELEKAQNEWEARSAAAQSNIAYRKLLHEKTGSGTMPQMTPLDLVRLGIVTPDEANELARNNLVINEPGPPVIGFQEPEKASIFTPELDNFARQYTRDDGKPFENMADMLAHAPGTVYELLSAADKYGTDDYDESLNFTQDDVNALKELSNYTQNMSQDHVEELFTHYADKQGVESDRLSGALEYLIDTGLTLEDKEKLQDFTGEPLSRAEHMELIAKRSDEEFGGERGNTFMRRSALSILGANAPEWQLNALQGVLSNAFAIETGVATGIMEANPAVYGTEFAKDLWLTSMDRIYRAKLGENYTYEQALDFDPILRALNDETRANNALVKAIGPDMSGYQYGANITRSLAQSLAHMRTMSMTGGALQNSVFPGMTDETLKGMSLLTKMAYRTTGFTPYIVSSFNDGYQQALDEGYDPQKAAGYGAWKGVFSGVVEGAVDKMYDGMSGKLHDLFRGYAKAGMDHLVAFNGMDYLRQLGTQVLGEYTEEWAELLTDTAGGSLILGKDFRITGDQIEETRRGARMAAAGALVNSIFFGLGAGEADKEYSELQQRAEETAKAFADGEVDMNRLWDTSANEEDYDRKTQRVLEYFGFAQAAMDDVAIKTTAEEQADEDIKNGAMDDLTGEASAPQKEIARSQMNLQLFAQKIEQHEQNISALDQQKSDVIESAVSNGIPIESGAVRQTLHNLDEQKAAEGRQIEETQEKIDREIEEQKRKKAELDAAIKQRRTDIIRQKTEEIRAQWEAQQTEANQTIQTRLAEIEQKRAEAEAERQKKLAEIEQKKEEALAKAREDYRKRAEEKANRLAEQRENESLADIMTDAMNTANARPIKLEPVDYNRFRPRYQEDIYGPATGNMQEDGSRESTQERNRRYHYTAYDLQDEVDKAARAAEEGSVYQGDDVKTIPADPDTVRAYSTLISYINDTFGEDTLDPKRYIRMDFTNVGPQEYDYVADKTEGAYITQGRSNGGGYLLIKDTRAKSAFAQDYYDEERRPGDYNPRNEGRPYIIMRDPRAQTDKRGKIRNLPAESAAAFRQTADTIRSTINDMYKQADDAKKAILKEIAAPMKEMYEKGEFRRMEDDLRDVASGSWDAESAAVAQDILDAIKPQEADAETDVEKENTPAREIYDNETIRNKITDRLAAIFNNKDYTGKQAENLMAQVDILSNRVEKYLANQDYTGLKKYLEHEAAGQEDDMKALLQDIADHLPEEENAFDEFDKYIEGRFKSKKDATRWLSEHSREIGGYTVYDRGKPYQTLAEDIGYVFEDPETAIEELNEINDMTDAEEREQAKDAFERKYLYRLQDFKKPSFRSKQVGDPYFSPLESDNDDYAVIHSGNGFNLVMKRSDVEGEDQNNNAYTETRGEGDNQRKINFSIRTVDDALRAIDAKLTEDAAVFAANSKLPKDQRQKRNPVRIMYAIADEEGNLKQHSYMEWRDENGMPVIPTARELLQNSASVTVNWPADDGTALSLVLERNELMPNAYDPRDPKTNKMFLRKDLRQAEAAFKRVMAETGGNPSVTQQLQYFQRVCDAYINSSLRDMEDLYTRYASGTMTDAELGGARKKMQEFRDAIDSWTYAANQIDAQQKASTADEASEMGIADMVKAYNDLLNNTKNASLKARFEILKSLEAYQAERRTQQLVEKYVSKAKEEIDQVDEAGEESAGDTNEGKTEPQETTTSTPEGNAEEKSQAEPPTLTDYQKRKAYRNDDVLSDLKRQRQAIVDRINELKESRNRAPSMNDPAAILVEPIVETLADRAQEIDQQIELVQEAKDRGEEIVPETIKPQSVEAETNEAEANGTEGNEAEANDITEAPEEARPQEIDSEAKITAEMPGQTPSGSADEEVQGQNAETEKPGRNAVEIGIDPETGEVYYAEKDGGEEEPVNSPDAANASRNTQTQTPRSINDVYLDAYMTGLEAPPESTLDNGFYGIEGEVSEQNQPVQMTTEEKTDQPYNTPPEEFLRKENLNIEQKAGPITTRETHDEAEREMNRLNDAINTLTMRIDEMQDAKKHVPDEQSMNDLIKQYIILRNRLKQRSKALAQQLSESDYASATAVHDLIDRLVQLNPVTDEEAVKRRRERIDSIYNRLDEIRDRMKERAYAGRKTSFSTDDIAYILADNDLKRELDLNQRAATELYRMIRNAEEETEALEKQRDEILNKAEANRTSEDYDQLGRLEARLHTLHSDIERCTKNMQALYHNGSKYSFEDIISGKGGGRLPENVQNLIFAILKDVQAKSKSTNSKLDFLNDFEMNPLRVVEKYFGEWAPLINAIYFKPVQQANARMARQENDIITRLKDSGVTAENEADIMRYIEGQMTDEQLREQYGQQQANQMIQAAKTFQDVYNELFADLNRVLQRNGLDPIPYRHNYTHHVVEIQGMIAKACSKLGIDISDATLPTGVAGHTADRRPRHNFMSGALQRTGNNTSYTLRANTLSYLASALKVIHQTDNITRLRQLEGYVNENQDSRKTKNRNINKPDSINAGVNQFAELVELPGVGKRKAKTEFSSFSNWLSGYTDMLSGKTSAYLDRFIAEKAGGRNALKAISWLKRAVGNNMILFNAKSAMSNLLPVFNSMGISPKTTTASILEIQHMMKSHTLDQFEQSSDFLTGRFGGESWNLSMIDVLEEKGHAFTGKLDRFAADVVVQTFRKMGMARGWTKNQSMKWADDMAWRMMASRNKGEGAVALESKTLGIPLQFTREGINNLQFMLKDAPAMRGRGPKDMMGILGILLSNYLFNLLMNAQTALDPIGAAQKSAREWDENATLTDNLKNTAGNLLETVDPTNLATGGMERTPVISTLQETGESIGQLAEAVFNRATGQEQDESAIQDAAGRFALSTIGYIPGGYSAERFFNGITDMIRGYTMDKNGNIKYALRDDDTTPWTIFDWITIPIFGESFSGPGREYARNGYQKMNRSQSAAFQTQMGLGQSPAEAYRTVKEGSQSVSKSGTITSNMSMPDWAVGAQDTDWMQAIIQAGAEAYPKETPRNITVNGVSRELTEEERQAFEKKYRANLSGKVGQAMEDGSSIASAAQKAYELTLKSLRKKLEEE